MAPARLVEANGAQSGAPHHWSRDALLQEIDVMRHVIKRDRAHIGELEHRNAALAEENEHLRALLKADGAAAE